MDSDYRPATARAAQVYARALALSRACPPGPPGRRTAAHDALDALVEHWPLIAAGTGDGDTMMDGYPGLWRRLVSEWPVGSYAQLNSRILQASNWLTGQVLEVGAGTGATTSLVAPLVRGDFFWSDRNLCEVRGPWAGSGVIFDLDRQPPAGLGGFTTIFATNALYPVADKAGCLAALRSLLLPGGVLVMAEGASPTTIAGHPWALDFLFCTFDGWWDRGGFLTRLEWLALMEQAGFRQLGYSVLRAGVHDLGGVIWGVA